MDAVAAAPWIAAASGLGGAAIGASAAVVAQFIAQNAIADRERTARERLERRTHALFAAYLQRIRHAILSSQSHRVPYWNFPELRSLVEPPRTMAQDPGTMLALSSRSIRKVTEALAIVDAAIQQAQDSTVNANGDEVEIIGKHTYIRDESSRDWVQHVFDEPSALLDDAVRQLEAGSGLSAATST